MRTCGFADVAVLDYCCCDVTLVRLSDEERGMLAGEFGGDADLFMRGYMYDRLGKDADDCYYMVGDGIGIVEA